MTKLAKTGCFTLATAICLGLGNFAVAQATPENTGPVATAGPQNLQSAAERTADWLSKQISPPSEENDSGGGLRLLSDSETKRSAIKTGATLTMVISLFLLAVFLWRLRPGSGKIKRTTKNEVVSVIGQVPFVHGQQLQIVRLGTRLLLVATSQSGSQTLSEISDPEEVLQIEMAFRQGGTDRLTQTLTKRARQSSTANNGISLGSHQPGGRTLLEA